MTAAKPGKARLLWVCRALCALIFSCALGSCEFLTDAESGSPIVCFVFDDEHISTWNNALPALREYGYTATSFVNSGRVGRNSTLSWEQIEALETTYGWEVGGHSLWHQDLSMMDLADAEYAIGQDYASLTAHGLNPRGFALPSGICPEGYYPLITRYYNYVRCSYDFALQAPVNPLALGYLSVQPGWGAEVVTDRIARGVANGEAMILIGFHRVGDTDPNAANNCTVADFRRILAYVQSRGLRVMTVSDALTEQR